MFNNLHIIGATAKLQFMGLNNNVVPARVDTGAKTSAVWASDIKLDGRTLSFYLFDKTSPYYDDRLISITNFTTRKVKNTSGITERRYVVKLPIIVNGRKIRASFTLANREKQEYPVLVGRNILRGKFAVDIKHIVKPEGKK